MIQALMNNAMNGMAQKDTANTAVSHHAGRTLCLMAGRTLCLMEQVDVRV